jgi:hypothetical protein
VQISLQALFSKLLLRALGKPKWRMRVLMMSVTGTTFPAAKLQLFAVKMINLSLS